LRSKARENALNNLYKNRPIFEKTLILEMIGSIRKYLVNTYFELLTYKQSWKNNNEIQVFGSANITSDYDITISGPNANEIMWLMFKAFLKK